MIKSLLTSALLFASFLAFSQQTVGLFQYDWQVDEGYVLWSPLLNGHEQYLMNNCGEVVYTWTTPLTTPANSMYLMDNGDLIYPAKADSAQNNPITGGGGGERVIRKDWNGNVLWDYQYYDATKRLHHDIEILPNGNILAIAWVLMDSTACIQAGRDPNKLSQGVLWSERVIEIEPAGVLGNIVWQWDLWDHMVQAVDSTKDNYGVVQDHPELLDVNWLNSSIEDSARADFVHLNSIDYNAGLDQIVLSSQVHSEIWIIDHSTSTAEAAGHSGGTYGKGGDFLYRYGNPQVYDRGTAAEQKLWRQHDSKWIPTEYPDGGGIMIFNNGLDNPVHFSEVDVITPPQSSPGVYTLDPGLAYGPDVKTWNYHAPDSVGFYSYFISGATRSASGNTLICAGAKGRMFEVNHVGDVVWEYVSPVAQTGVLGAYDTIPLAGGGAFQGNLVFRSERYSPDHPWLAAQNLTNGTQLEPNPVQANCLVSIDPSVSSGIEVPTFYPNPAQNSVVVSGVAGYRLEIINTNGQLVRSAVFAGVNEEVDISGLETGLYFLRFTSDNEIHISKLIVN